jgi:glycosyltransferase involved in cell wall biosynthesis
MRIAQVAPIVERVPPKMYGGTERMVNALTEELVARGHEVTLFASGDSVTSATLRAVYPRGLREAHLPDLYGLNPWTLLNAGLAYSLEEEFDIIHDHLAPLSLPIANMARTPVVATIHGAFNPDTRRLFQILRKPYIATISHSQGRHEGTAINHAGVVHNGLAMESYPFGATPGEYLLFVGRMSMQKGVHIAIAVAQELDLPLLIAAKLDAEDEQYFNFYVKPRLGNRIEWIGEVNEAKRNELMSNAKCFLLPAMWREPFGLTLIEAAACGCPVVAFNRGSIPEIVVDGVTGFIVDDIEEMTDAVAKIDTIDRAACRAHALSRFSARRMTDDYEEMYRKILTSRTS